MNKVKLTITVDDTILKSAKRAAAERRTPISRAIDGFLRFYSRPEVYCFKCGEKINTAEASVCPRCGWMTCPKCNGCRCKLSEETAVAVYHMRRVFEELLGGRVK
jgi:hypothetical protein